MASILAEADLKGVKASDAFYLKYKDALEIGNSKIRELVDEIQKTSIYLPQSKIPKASELKLDGQKVKTEVTQDSKVILFQTQSFTWIKIWIYRNMASLKD